MENKNVQKNQWQDAFNVEARHVLDLKIAHRVNRLGGYGSSSEVIYEGHPSGCPSVLVDSRNGATATFMSNGSVGFTVKIPCLLYTSPSPRDRQKSRMPSSA